MIVFSPSARHLVPAQRGERQRQVAVGAGADPVRVPCAGPGSPTRPIPPEAPREPRGGPLPGERVLFLILLFLLFVVQPAGQETLQLVQEEVNKMFHVLELHSHS